MNQLQKALLINAIFSGLSGIVLIVAHNYLAQLFAVENKSIFWIIGGLLIVFAVSITYEIQQQRRAGVLTIKEEAWQVISDVANYHKVAPNIDGVEVVSGEGKGMIRRCSHGEDHWTETCSLWVPEQVYSFEVDTHAHNYPYPFKSLRGQWEVESSGQSASKITMLFEFQYKRKFQKLAAASFS
ncbi:MAG: SRPBCC family protein [Bacteroidota bacterium]